MEFFSLLLVEQTFVLVLPEDGVKFVSAYKRLCDFVDDCLVISFEFLNKLNIAPDEFQLRPAKVDLVLFALEDFAWAFGVT